MQRWYGQVAHRGERRGYAPFTMPLVVVTLLSILVGGAVYLATVRGQRMPSATGFGQAEEDTTAADDAVASVPGAPPPGDADQQV